MIDVENSTGLSVIEVVGHTLVDGTIGDDIDVVTNSVGGEDVGDSDGTVSSEGLGELGSSSGFVSVRVRHLVCLY